MTTVQQLTHVFNDNFMAYFHSHVAHVNITGRSFQSDHAFLGTIYEDLQDQIDHIGELLRSLQAQMPDNLADIIADSEIMDLPVSGSADGLLGEVQADLQQLRDCYEQLMSVADKEGHRDIANYAQDRMLTLAKYLWQLRSMLE